MRRGPGWRGRRERKANDAKRTRKAFEIDRKISRLTRAIEDGHCEPSFKERLQAVQNERMALGIDGGEADAKELTILSHPNLPQLYRRKVEQLEAILEGPDRAEAMDHHLLDDRSARGSQGCQRRSAWRSRCDSGALRGSGAKEKRPGSFDLVASIVGGSGGPQRPRIKTLAPRFTDFGPNDMKERPPRQRRICDARRSRSHPGAQFVKGFDRRPVRVPARSLVSGPAIETLHNCRNSTAID
jgi:hypothetical protein